MINKFIDENFIKTDKINRKVGSYRLKHYVEERIDQYVSTDHLIDCMMKKGFKFEKIPGETCGEKYKNNYLFGFKLICKK